MFDPESEMDRLEHAGADAYELEQDERLMEEDMKRRAKLLVWEQIALRAAWRFVPFLHDVRPLTTGARDALLMFRAAMETWHDKGGR